MSIRYKCAECGATMKIKDELAGTSGHCPKCKTEFVVPPPDEKEPVPAKSSTEDAEDLENDEKEAPQKEPTKKEASKKEAAVTEESLEDEYQRILMGDDPPGGRASRNRPADSDAFLSAESSDEHPAATDAPRRDDPKSDPPPTKAKAKTTAEISASLMKNTAEPTLKKTGKAFGDASSDRDAGRKKVAAEARAYYIKQIAIGGVGLVVIAGGLYWLMSSMMGGTKLPPLARIYGTVTLDGKPLVGATVSFQPVMEGPGAKITSGGSVGITDAKGAYEAYYIQNVRGAAIGKHIIQVRAQNEVGVEVVPDKFNSNSQLQLVVKPGSNPPFDIQITK